MAAAESAISKLCLEMRRAVRSSGKRGCSWRSAVPWKASNGVAGGLKRGVEARAVDASLADGNAATQSC
jgi:hypothetical protein